MNNEHPKAVAARAAAESKRIERNVEKERLAYAKREYGVRFLTVGKYTFCYRVDKRNVIEASSTIRHPGDKNDPHIGRMHALARFAAANRMHMRMPNWCRSPRAFLKFTFSE